MASNGAFTKNPEVGKLAAALIGLRHTLATTRYTLKLPGAEEAEASRAATVAQLDDYLLPRIRRLDAPLLVVVGGSTGAGKSTLVNSLVRAPVSPAGVLRPTTRAPVLVCHPADLPWFAGNHLLPGLARTSGPSTDQNSLQVVNAAHLSPGLAFLDAPDIDSVVDSNRALATQLLAAADLWLFVTTAARYADAVPWALLRTARERGTVVALVLDRVPPGAADEIGPHLLGMLRDKGLGSAPLFVLPEASLDGQGLLAERVITPLRAWFDELANSTQARTAVVRRTVGGGIDALGPIVAHLADAADEQVAADKTLAEAVTTAYADAQLAIENGMHDGILLRGEVLSRWQELVGTGDLMRALQARIGRARDRVVASVTGRPAPGKQFQAALESGVVTLIRGAAADAAEKASTAWQQHAAGRNLLTPELRKPSPDLQANAERLVRDWQRAVLDLVRQEAEGKLKIAKVSAYAVNATGLLVMVSVFAATAFIPTGLEVATAAGTTVAAQKVLEAIFGDQAVRTLAEQARADLLTRVQSLLHAEAARFDGPRAMTMVDPRTAWRLRDSASDVVEARQVVDLPAGEVPRPGLIKTAGDR
ncbi:GTPase domain-containing protein [Virgisporangium aurantiacum]|uniref:GTPase domain-containing protein n=1 Tax=Virgisporangium aurantiacum TaxID=175570 RepID=UPI00194E4F38